MTTTRHVVVEELSRGTEVDALDPAVVDRLHRLEFVRVTSRVAGKAWVEPRRKVGSVRVGDVQVTVRPKLSIRRVLFLLGYANDPNWQDDDVDTEEDQEVVPAVVDALARRLARAFPNGVPQGYRTVEDVATVLRGRLRTGAQASRRLGSASPVEIEHNEYDTDTTGNRILATAVRRAIRVPGLRPATVAELRRAAGALDRVPALPSRDAVPAWAPGDRGSAYDDAVRLARVLLTDRSIELSDDPRREAFPAAAFTVDMWRVFEAFVGKALKEATRVPSLRTNLGMKRQLDEAGLMTAIPDVLWVSNGAPFAVADIKYKVEEKRPNDDVYQVLAYCLSYGLSRGHLVYAKGSATPVVHRVGGIRVDVHAVDLDMQPRDLRAQVETLAARILDVGA